MALDFVSLSNISPASLAASRPSLPLLTACLPSARFEHLRQEFNNHAVALGRLVLACFGEPLAVDVLSLEVGNLFKQLANLRFVLFLSLIDLLSALG